MSFCGSVPKAGARRDSLVAVMPLDEKIPGFSNRWYKAAMEASVTRKLRDDLEIRIVTAAYFVATKLEAFKGRGRGDFPGGHDLEDVISVVAGRETLSAEVRDAGPELSQYVRSRDREIAGKS